MQSIGIHTQTVQASDYRRISLKDFSAVTVDAGIGRGKVTINNPVQAFIRHDGTLTVQGPRGNARNVALRFRKNGDYTVTARQGQGNIVAFFDHNGEQVSVYDVPDVPSLLAFLDNLLNGWNI